MTLLKEKAFFVSDLHLGSVEEPKCLLFLKFLDQLIFQKATHLFLVGDVFDLWLADHQYFIDKFSPVVTMIKKLVDAGVEVHYFEGNHDLYLKDFWQNQLGVIVHENIEYFRLANLTIRVEHGDLIDPEDRGYRFLRWFLRTPVMQVFSRQMPGSIVAKIGEKASAKSRTYTSEIKTISTEIALEKLHKYAAKEYLKKPFDLLISGHIHEQDDYSFTVAEGKTARSVNLGTWLRQPTVFIITPEEQKWQPLT